MSTTKPKTKIKWRLGRLPEPNEVAQLVTEGILSKDEAREILISHETDEDRDNTSLKGEIKFLRELVQKLSNNRRTEIVKQIEYIEKPYRRYDWWEPYKFYCTTGNGTGSLTIGAGTTTATAGYLDTSATNAVYTTASSQSDFTDIKTF